MNIDQKLQLIGREIYLGMVLTEFLPIKEWEFILANIYSMKLVQYGEIEAYSFYLLENLDDETYKNLYEELYPERSEEDVWLEKRNELGELFNKSQYSYHLLEVLNKY